MDDFESRDSSNNTATPGPDNTPSSETESVTDDITINPEAFNEYWFERIATRNETEDHPERNDAGHMWPLGRFEPHQLGWCHRKWMYGWLNAPEEDRDPHGIFAIGHYIEEEIIEPWLADYFGDGITIDNTVHVGATVSEFELTDELPDPPVQTDTSITVPDHVGYEQEGETAPLPAQDAEKACITVAGSTDPAVRHDDTDEILALTEVKSTSSIDRYRDSPKDGHLYQLHAYMKALEIESGYIIYVDKENLLSPAVHEITFSEDVWETVVEWMETAFSYAVNETLPPANPPKAYMCKYCNYRNRCGKGRSNLATDMNGTGFVPGYGGYPKEKVKEHLEAHDDVSLTPTLALKYPELAAQYSVRQWECPNCTAEFAHTDEDIDSFSNEEFKTPYCPACESVFDKKIHLT